MSAATVRLATVDLDNCDKEPIHVPGHVQPHGVLLAFDLQGVLTHASRNAAVLFPALSPLGQRPPRDAFGQDPALYEALAVATVDATLRQQGTAMAIELALAGTLHDVVLHAFDDHILVECEQRDHGHGDLAQFALLAHRSMARLRNRTDIEVMLREVVATVRDLTGFDRVMAYRFHHDDSGEVVAELHHADQAPYLGRRFPAADIPAQARRLYVLNTLRLIADVNDVQVAIDGQPGAPLDLSHAVLRSVSPIHIEYLKNIGVAASMSLSIVVRGRLWGLIACHHRSAHRVAYAIRMACDVLAQMVSSSVQDALDKGGAALRASAASLRLRLTDTVLHTDDLLHGLTAEREALLHVLAADASLFAYGGRSVTDSALAPAAVAQCLAWLDEQPEVLIAVHARPALPAELREALHPWCGFLALCFDRAHGGWLVLLRHAQLETVTWSGPVDKVARMGPLGARLTPDGSFAEWRQTVEDTARPWEHAERALAYQLLDELSRAASLRRAETDRARTQLLLVLGHDLRDPLHSIGIAARMLERDATHARTGQRIAASTGRMERLITQVLDISRLHGGLGLGMQPVACDVAALLRTTLEEMAFSYPDVQVDAQLPPRLFASIDTDRFGQVVGNLLGNARQHGQAGTPIGVRLFEGSDGGLVMQVTNAGHALPDGALARLFEPLKQQSMGNPLNPGGLGLGLYIASEIVKGHGGTLVYSHDGSQVIFTVRLPATAVQTGTRPVATATGTPENAIE